MYRKLPGKEQAMNEYNDNSIIPENIQNKWICPECGCEVGNNDPINSCPQPSGNYCPDCGKRINWSYISDHFFSGRLSNTRIYRCRTFTKPVKPIFKSVSTPVIADYTDGTSKKFIERHTEYQCPVCGLFVDSHIEPFAYQIAVNLGKKKPCSFCRRCGQKIRWTGIKLDPKQYETG